MIARTTVPLRFSGFALLLVTFGTFAAHAPPARPPVAPGLLSGLVWRNLGPFRGGRIAAVSGAIGQPGVFYVGLPAGGVWKTTSAGETWTPIFDGITAASSVGAVEVAPSDPNVIYVGMGDLISGGGINEGNGVYKSVDAGKTWQHLGLDSTKQIPSILVDPHDPNLVMIAAQGDVHNKSASRGVFRSTDGGKTWTKTLRGRFDRPAEARLGRGPPRDRARDQCAALRRANHGPCPRTAGRGRWWSRWRWGRRDGPHTDEALQIYRQRSHVARSHRRGPAASQRPDRGGRGDEYQRTADVPDRQLRPVPLRRRRHHLAPDGRRRPAHRQRAGRLQLRCLRRPQEPRCRLHHQHLQLPVHRRRQHVHRFQGSPRG